MLKLVGQSITTRVELKLQGLRRWMSSAVVMSFGDGSQGAVGLPTSTTGHGGDAYEPTRVPGLPSDVTSVAAGHYHSLALTSQAQLWAWGRNNEAQLGRGSLDPRDSWNEPKRVEGLDKVNVCAAFASGVVSAAIGDDGSLWVWGKSKRGQLGLGKGIIEAVVPSRVETLSGEKIAKVSFGWGHALALTEDGKLFGWGYSADARLGKVRESFEKSPLESNAGISENNGQLSSSAFEVAEKLVLEGIEKEKDMPIVWDPCLVEELRGVEVVDISCGLDHSLVLCRNGTLLSCGSNVYGQLGRVKQDLGRVVGMPQLEGSSALSNTRTAAGGFSMGQVVQEAEPVFSGAHEGLCLCSSRLLFPLWELPVMVVKGGLGSTDAFSENGVVVCRLSVGAMQVLESKIRSLEKFLRSRRNQRRGLYGCVAGLGDLTGSILYGTGSELGADDRSMVRNLFGSYSRNVDSSGGGTTNKRQRLQYNPAELAAMEVRAMECIRQLLLRSGEALFLLQLLSQHHVTRLVQGFDANLRQALVQLTFHQLVCSEEGDRLATRLISALMEYYTGPDGRGTVDDISAKLREGCPSYYKEPDYKFFLAVECLERAAITPDAEEKENLAREAFNYLSKVPESADLRTVCKRFEDLRFYEAVVRLPLQKAQALDPAGDAYNEQIDAATREHALAQREQCYEIIISALRSLKGDTSQREFGSPVRPATATSFLDQSSRKKYICQIVQLGVQSPDRIFHEYLYRAMIDLGLENELLEYGGPDLVPFLQSAGREPIQEVRAVSAVTSATSFMGQSGAPIPSNRAKYFDLLARYYVLKRQHVLAAHILGRLAERRSTDSGDVLTLEQRCRYLSNAVLQAKNASNSNGLAGSTQAALDSGMLDLLEGKLAVLRFQIKIKEELEAIASRLEASPGASESMQNDPPENDLTADASVANAAREKAKELSLELKSITQLYNEYAVPFELWEICLEMLYFANYSGDADSSIVRETWARLIDQALSTGGISEACSVLKRVGSHIYPGDGAVLSLDTLCLHLEKAALERSETGVESVGDEDVPRALLAACKGATEPVLNTYDQLLSNGAILPSPKLKLRLLRSVLVVLREWAMSVFAQRIGTSATGASLILGGTFSLEQTAIINQGVRDKITSAANRYMTEVRRLALPQSQTEAVYRGFRELEESLISPFSFDRF